MEMSKEQAAALQEKIKKMSPEELKAFQKQQCIFCHIISGKVASKKIYEDENCMAVLDINPANPGHILLLPKEHYSIMPQLNEKETAHLFMAAKHLAHALLKALKAEGVNIFVANGVAAGQRAQHLMIHIIPRKENDGLNLNIPQHEMSEGDIDTVRAILTKSIAEKTGVAVKETQEAEKPPSKKPKTVEAEFEEKKETVKEKTKGKEKTKEEKKAIKTEEKSKEKTKQESETKQKTKTKERQPKKTRQTRPEKEEKANLDDIANLLGAR